MTITSRITSDMRVQNFHLLSELPDPGPPGTPPPLAPKELLEMVADRVSLHYAVERVFLMDDLLIRDACLSGERSTPDGVVLSPAQLRGEAPLPDFLVLRDSDGGSGRASVDAVWAAYFQHVFDTAERLKIRFLASWAAFEVALRNSLAGERAQRLGLEPGPFLVSPHTGYTGIDLEATIAEWASATDPLAAQRVVDSSRWEWLVTHDHWYSFSNDEVVAYAAKLQVITRIHRILDRSEAETMSAAGAEI